MGINKKILFLVLNLCFFPLKLEAFNTKNFSMICVDNFQITKEYYYSKNQICIKNTKENCYKYLSADKKKGKFVIRINETLKIVDFIDKKISVSQDSRVFDHLCKNSEILKKVLKNNDIKKKINDFESITNSQAEKILNIRLLNFEETFNSLITKSYDDELNLEIKKIEKKRKLLKKSIINENSKSALLQLQKIENDIISFQRLYEHKFNLLINRAKDDLMNLDYLGAKKNIELVLSIDSSSKEANYINDQIEKLPNKIKIYKKIKIAKKENNKEKELFYLNQLKKIDNSDSLLKSINDLKNEIKFLKFNEVIALANIHLKKNDLKNAKLLLIEAKKLDPKRNEISLIQKQIDLLNDNNQIEILWTNYDNYIANDNWKSAYKSLEKLKQLDENNALILTKMIEANKIINLTNDLIEYQNNIYRLSNEKFRQNVNLKLDLARNYLNKSNLLSKQVDEINNLIDKFDNKVSIKIISDNKTEIEIRGVGFLGLLNERVIKLSIGRYFFIGKRKGFKNAFIEVDLLKQNDVIFEVTILCSEPI